MEAKSNPVNWFEIPVTDFNRAKEFYEHILDIEIKVNKTENFTMGWFPWVREGTVAAGTLMQADSYVPSHEGAMIYFSVEDIEGTLEKLKRKAEKY
jgi:predicted enzyme related to lactoylglutathione lyase